VKDASFKLYSTNGAQDGKDARRFAIASDANGVAIVTSRCYVGLEPIVESAVGKLEDSADERSLTNAFAAIDTYARRTRPDGYFPGLVMAAVDRPDNAVRIVHLGDTRAYLLRQNILALRPGSPAPEYSPDVMLADGSTLVCLTYDQSTACELVELGLMTREEGRNRARRPILTHYLGSVPPSEADVFSLDLVAGDRLLLCTSALWLKVADHEIADALQADDDPGRAFDILTECAGPGPLALIDCVSGSAESRESRVRSGVRAEVTPPPAAAPSDSEGRTRGVLSELGRDLTEWSEDKPAASFVGREEQLRELMRSLMRMRKANVLLVGDPGVGKTWLVEALAARLRTGPCPPALRGKRVVELSMGSLVSGTRYRGDFESRIQAILAEAADPDLILFIDEVHLALQSGSASEGSMDAANLLKPALARGELRLIGATTTREFDRYVARDEAFLRRFEVMRLDEPSPAETLTILRRMANELEAHHGLSIDADAIDASISLSVRHMVDRRLPDKAIDLLDQACTRAASRWMSVSLTTAANANASGSRVERIDVAAVVARRCGVPIDLVLLDDGERLAKLDSLLSERIIGQTHAVELASNAIKNSYAGLKHPDKPVASLLFVGPTGVGKTAMARGIAELVFSSEEALLRLDMSEYMEKHAVSRLLGAAPGYVGHGEGGQLSASLRARPGMVVLFDEIEKAHPDVLQLLLQILDNGSLRDSRGDDVSFRDAIIVLTSNLTVAPAEREIGFGRGRAADDAGNNDDKIREQLRGSLKPELLGRLTRVVQFQALPADALARIADKTLQQLLERVLSGEIDAAPPRSLRKTIHAQLASSPFGARDIERLVETEVGRWLTAHRQKDPQAGAPIVPGAVIVDRLPKGRRTSVALVHIECAADLATPRAEVDRKVHELVDNIVGSAHGIELRYLQYAARGVLAVFGGVLSAHKVVGDLSEDWRWVVHWGRIERDTAGHPSGSAIDRLFELARTSEERGHTSEEANAQRSSVDAGVP